MPHIARMIYPLQSGNGTIKGFRWWHETVPGPRTGGGGVTRNSVINESLATQDGNDPERREILHQYFIGLGRFEEYLAICRSVIPASFRELLINTLGHVAADMQSTQS